MKMVLEDGAFDDIPIMSFLRFLRGHGLVLRARNGQLMIEKERKGG